MNFIALNSRPSLLLFILIGVFSLIILTTTGIYWPVKILLLLVLVYLIDSDYASLSEKDGILEASKGYLFKRKKIVEINKLKNIKLIRFNNKGGNGFEIYFSTNDKQIKFTKQSETEEIDNEIEVLKTFFEMNNDKIKFVILKRWEE